MEDFVNLHSHTYHSHMDAIIRIPDLFKKVVELNQPGIAITDHGVLAGIHEGYKEYKKYKEKGQLVKFIPGSEIYFCEDIGDPKAKRRHLILLAQNEEGYRNLLQINAAGFKNSVSVMGREFPRVDLNIIKKHSAGLFINSACGGSPFAAAIFEKNYTKARDFAARFQDLFGDKFHVELQPHEMQRGDFNQSYLNDQLKNLAEELKIDMIATCDSHYLTAKHEKYHDMILAIGAKKSLEDPTRHRYATYPPCLICAGTGVYPVDSNKECYECNGKKYSAIKSCPEFYLKGRDALVSHFAKKFDSEVAHALVNNTVKIANACEYPDYMEVKGARLPSFPWKDESDAPEFKEWLDSKPALSDIKDDAAFLRFRVKKGFDKYTASFTKEKKQQYWDRVKKELDILESRSFSSYMLIVADYIQWAKNNGVTVGSGRGCLVGNTPVLKYDGGFTQLKDIRVGDRVFTHTGDVQTVTDTMVYDVSNEDLLSIKTDFSFESIELTKDHQVYAVKRKISDRYARYADKGFSSLNKIRKFDSEIESPQWVQAQDLNVGDLIFMPFPKRQVREFQDIDLSKYCNAYDEKFVYITKNLSNELSKRTINRETGLSRGYLSSVKNKAHTKYRKDEQDRILTKYLEQYGHTVNSWINLKNIEIKRIPRYIKVDSEFCYFIGKWIGDGWFRKTSETNMIGIAFNSDDVDEIDRTSNYLASIGFESTPIRHNTKNLIQLCSYGKIQAQLLKDLFKDYESTSGSKYIGEFKYLNDHLLKELLLGLLSADGHIETGSSRINFDTTSRRMAEEIKECLLYLHIPSSISTREPYTHGIYECSKAYKVRAKGLCVEKSKADNIFVDNGYLCRITDISTTRASHVYDITVENDHSYVTSNYAVHNSVGGSLVAYLLGIHMADSIKFGLLFERFQNKEKKSLPDIDVDFSPAGREKVIQYCRDKYGEDKVAFISNIMRLTPKLVIKDVARSLILGGDKSTAFQMANDVTASIPDLILDGDKRIKVDTMAKAMDVSEKLRKFVADYPVILEYANELIGIPRGFATHAAGIVISDIPLQEFVPLRRDRDGSVSIQYDKDACEENGLVKMDFLGLETLDIIDETLQIAEGVGISLTKPDKLEDGDAKTYKLIQLGHTAGMFQLNGSMTPLCKAMLPK